MFVNLYYCTDTKTGYSVADYHADGVYFTFTFGPFGVTEHSEK